MYPGRIAALLLAPLALAALGGCGDNNHIAHTTLQGSVVAVSPNGDQEHSMVVCIRGTAACDHTDDNGNFKMSGPVEGNLTLVFTGAFFSASMPVDNVPVDGVVTLNNIVCHTDTGDCEAGSVVIGTPVESPMAGTPGPTATGSLSPGAPSILATRTPAGTRTSPPGGLPGSITLTPGSPAPHTPTRTIGPGTPLSSRTATHTIGPASPKPTENGTETPTPTATATPE